MALMLAVSILFGLSVYLVLDKNLLKKIFGFLLFASAINLVILICGRLNSTHPAFVVAGGVHHVSNALAQALILTAIVIGFALLCLLMIFLKSGDAGE